jgi:hypothetical protein
LSDETKNRIRQFVDLGGLLKLLAGGAIGSLAIVWAWGQADARKDARIDQMDEQGTKAFRLYRETIDRRLDEISDIAKETRSDVKWLMRERQP